MIYIDTSALLKLVKEEERELFPKVRTTMFQAKDLGQLWRACLEWVKCAFQLIHN